MAKNNGGKPIKPVIITKKDSVTGSFTKSEGITPKKPGSGGGKSGKKNK